jgi:hypothetical protein
MLRFWSNMIRAVQYYTHWKYTIEKIVLLFTFQNVLYFQTLQVLDF